MYKRIFGQQKSLVKKKIGQKIFGQNLFGQNMFPGAYILSFIKIGSVTAEILLTMGGGGLHFHVKPSLGYVRLRLSWVGVVITKTILMKQMMLIIKFPNFFSFKGF